LPRFFSARGEAGWLCVAHDDPGVGTAYERTTGRLNAEVTHV
jgi:hypothetical protein